MLGEKIGEARGQITSVRVLEGGTTPKVETSFQAEGTFLGIEGTEMGTYWSVIRPGGVLYGEGQGVVMTKDGGTASWTGNGVGKFTGKGSAVSWRGSIFYQTTHERLLPLNRVAVVFEFESDENGKTHAKIWEWK